MKWWERSSWGAGAGGTGRAPCPARLPAAGREGGAELAAPAAATGEPTRAPRPRPPYAAAAAGEAAWPSREEADRPDDHRGRQAEAVSEQDASDVLPPGGNGHGCTWGEKSGPDCPGQTTTRRQVGTGTLPLLPARADADAAAAGFPACPGPWSRLGDPD